jgi:hypothetical protein
MLDTLLCLNLGIDSGSRSSCVEVSLDEFDEFQFFFLCYLPAAAAGSRPSFVLVLVAGLSARLSRGLRLRFLSGLVVGGDLERRSNLEARFGSGSFWSKRERFAVRRSVSSIVDMFMKKFAMCAPFSAIGNGKMNKVGYRFQSLPCARLNLFFWGRLVAQTE